MRNKNIIIVYLVVTLVFLSEVVLNFNQYSYAGYYTDKIIGWLWLALTIFIIIRLWKKKAIKVYFGLLVAGIILSILPMMLPFFALVSYFSTIDSYQRISLNNDYRIERYRPGALSKPQMAIYQQKGILEKRISKTPYVEILERVVQRPSIDIPSEEQKEPIQEAKFINANKDSIGIEYKIMNKKQIFYHQFTENSAEI
ncbi:MULTISPECIES: hypothetical protein [unclassified Chryseobacterium]|uniref:hypothetical protein n=1 Tax=unclassified Chryseobacterium TaxID=2593645 RepID=UPI00100BD11C|nr:MULTISPECIES: hypothetical protein [unclassified Chryseobacterium]RXM49875.1 hypothetical protein BOQ64_21595 [Chryseobacterium sp. CH25]RXM62021.1 hypothetical protein BOQ60_22370 [Chryseobacterium sp. CH1]